MDIHPVMLIVVGLKCYARLRLMKEIGLDDVLVLISAVCLRGEEEKGRSHDPGPQIMDAIDRRIQIFHLVTELCPSRIVPNELGRHIKYLTLQGIYKFSKIIVISNPWSVLAASLPSIAVAIFINRILALPPWCKWLIIGIAILQGVIAIVEVVLFFTAKIPLNAVWDPNVKPISTLPDNVLLRFSYLNAGRLHNTLGFRGDRVKDRDSFHSIYGNSARGCPCCCVLQTSDED